VFSQVVNIESIRKSIDSSKFRGSVKLDYNISKDVNTLIEFTNEFRIQYLSGKNMLLFVNDFSFKKLNGNQFNNKNLQHLRYNYLFNKRVALESFIQHQKDEVLGINNRSLFGLGTRFLLYLSEKHQFYLGTLLMQEYDNSDGEFKKIIENTTRGDLYVSFILRPNKVTTIANTTYYQPKIASFSDYRIASETAISLKIYKHLFFTSTFTFQNDNFPVFSIPKEQYKLENGLTYTF
jgi:hypothetical protein